MIQLGKLQLVGPMAVFVAVGSAEASAALLTHWPSSEILWRANLQWFHAFQKSSYALSAYTAIAYSQFLIVAVPLIVIAACGLALKRPLLLATASNLSFVYALFVLCADHLYDQSWREASLSLTATSSNPDSLVCFFLVAASFVSFAVSHLYYIRAVRGGVR